MTAARRARLIAGLAPWASARLQYRLTLGGAVLPFSALSANDARPVAIAAELRAVYDRTTSLGTAYRSSRTTPSGTG